jgi:hypothetical protein
MGQSEQKSFPLATTVDEVRPKFSVVGFGKILNFKIFIAAKI